MTDTAKGTFIVKNIRGLHTRPSTELVKCATKFKSKIILKYQEMEADGISLLGILMFAATKGAKIQVEAVGKDASQAVETILTLAAMEFNIKY